MLRLLITVCLLWPTLVLAGPYKITVLATNISDYGGLGEWSFSAVFESDEESVLFDTGFKNDTVLHNVLHLGIDLARTEKVVLSHFHSDHTGGLLVLRKHFRDSNPKALSIVYVARGFFDQRKTRNGSLVGPGEFQSAQDFRGAAEAMGISFVEVDSPTEIAPNLWLTGPVPRLVEAYNGPAGLFIDGPDGPRKDIIIDDQSLGYLTDRGWLMTSGCGHSGLINTGNVLQSIKKRAGLFDCWWFSLMASRSGNTE